MGLNSDDLKILFALKREQYYLGFRSVFDYVEGPRKYAKINCYWSRYHTCEFSCKGVSYIICIKNEKSRLKPTVGTKQIKGEDMKFVKTGVILKSLMDAWNIIKKSFTKYLYDKFVIHFRRMYEKYPDFLKYVKSTIQGWRCENCQSWCDIEKPNGCMKCLKKSFTRELY